MLGGTVDEADLNLVFIHNKGNPSRPKPAPPTKPEGKLTFELASRPTRRASHPGGGGPGVRGAPPGPLPARAGLRRFRPG